MEPISTVQVMGFAAGQAEAPTRTAILDTGERVAQLAAAALNGDVGRARLCRSFGDE